MKHNISKAVVQISLFSFYCLATCNLLNAQIISERNAVKLDTAYTNKLLIKASNLFSKDNVRSLQLAKEALDISNKLTYNKGIAKSYYAIGNAYNISAKFDMAKEAYENALEQSQKNNDKAIMQLCYTSLGNVSSKLDDYKNGEILKEKLDMLFKMFVVPQFS